MNAVAFLCRERPGLKGIVGAYAEVAESTVNSLYQARKVEVTVDAVLGEVRQLQAIAKQGYAIADALRAEDCVRDRFIDRDFKVRDLFEIALDKLVVVTAGTRERLDGVARSPHLKPHEIDQLQSAYAELVDQLDCMNGVVASIETAIDFHNDLCVKEDEKGASFEQILELKYGERAPRVSALFDAIATSPMYTIEGAEAALKD